MQSSYLYFIAIMLPQKIDEEILVFKKDIAYRFQSSKALRTASHITLKAPFKISSNMHVPLLQWFTTMNISVAPFIQAIQDFGAFGNKNNPVIFVKPLMNASLQQLQQEVLQQFEAVYSKEMISKNEYHFSPHITIAYRDLQPACFKEAWKEYNTKQYNAAFEVNSFQLLQHSNGRWNVARSCLLHR